MQAVGMIVEYNPFHNGHQWHINAAKKESGCPFAIGVMSGNFMQRGEPALFDKWKRAEMAVRSGLDLVIELPTVFAVRSAQYFATGGIRLLEALGIVSHVCFGAEHADLTILKKMVTAMEQSQIINDMYINLKSGNTYAAALGKSLEEHVHISAEVIASSNNILAAQYLRAIEKFAPHLIALPVSRQQSRYNDTVISTPFASATAIRHALLNNQTITNEIRSSIPETTFEILHSIIAQQRGPVTFSSLSAIILAQLRISSLEKIEQLPGVSEGLHYKIRDSALLAANIAELFSLLKSRRYPYTRLQRIIAHSLLGTNKTQVMQFDEYGPLYARVLAFNQNGRLLLKEIQKHSKIPLITKTTHFLNSKQRGSQTLTPLQNMLAIDTVASDVYSLGMPASSWNKGAWDFRYPAFYLP